VLNFLRFLNNHIFVEQSVRLSIEETARHLSEGLDSPFMNNVEKKLSSDENLT